jgi:hypothetical protein
MELTIKSRVLGDTFTFWMYPCDADGTGCIFLTSPGRRGTDGQQICEGGRFLGSTLSASEATFEATCRRWYQARLRRTMREVAGLSE